MCGTYKEQEEGKRVDIFLCFSILNCIENFFKEESIRIFHRFLYVQYFTLFSKLV